MDTKKIENLIKLMKKHSLYELELEDDDERVRLVSGPTMGAYMAPQPMAVHHHEVSDHEGTPAKEKPHASGKEIRSPFVGTYYEGSSPEAEPFVRSGQRVKKGDVLCIIEAMKIMNEIEAEFDCTIKSVLVSNEQPVEFDQPLFVVE